MASVDVEMVRSIASDLRVLDDDGGLRPLDSLTLVEFVNALEDASGVDLRGIRITIEHFRSVESVVKLFDRTGST